VTKEEIREIVESSKAPKGVFAQTSSGKLLFLSDKDAERMAVPSAISGVLESWVELKKAAPPSGVRERLTAESCNRIQDWLVKAPRDEVWMGVAKEYLAKC
jgi:hypothetical protein